MPPITPKLLTSSTTLSGTYGSHVGFEGRCAKYWGAYSPLTSSYTFNGISLTGVGIVQFNKCGDAQWVAQGINSVDSTADFGYALTYDRCDNSYLIGEFKNNITFGQYTLTADPNPLVTTFFVIKVDDAGIVQWALTFTAVNSVTVYSYISKIRYSCGNLYISGSYSDSLTVDGQTINTTVGSDIFVVKLDAGTGDIRWLRSFGQPNVLPAPPQEDFPFAMIVNKGQTLLTGGFDGTLQLGNFMLVSNVSTYIAGPLEFNTTYVTRLNCAGVPTSAFAIQRGTVESVNFATVISADTKSQSTYMSGLIGGTNYFGPCITTVSPDISTMTGDAASAYLTKFNSKNKFSWLVELAFTDTVFGAGAAVTNVIDAEGNIYMGIPAVSLNGTLNIYMYKGGKKCLKKSVSFADSRSQILIVSFTSCGKFRFATTAITNWIVNDYPSIVNLVVLPGGVLIASGPYRGTAQFGTLTTTTSEIDFYVAKYKVDATSQESSCKGSCSCVSITV